MAGRNSLTHEKEITSEVLECLDDGTLNPEAVGFSRRPLHRCNLKGSWGRKKRWDYWCVTSREGALSITYADIDYIGLATVSFLDFETKEFTEKVAVVPLARGFSQPETVAGSDVVFNGSGLHFGIHEEKERARVVVSFKKLGGPHVEAELEIDRPATHETLNVLVPWSDTRFQFTSKKNTLPTRGHVTVGKRRYEFGAANDSFATLDFGRGKWPRKTTWNWGSASGHSGEDVIGLQFGGKWTDGTGVTESGLVINGKLSKIGEAIEWTYNTRDYREPWLLKSRESRAVDLVFDPFYERTMKLPLGSWGAEVHQCFGRYSGRITDEEGQEYEIEDIIGWAEEMRASW